MIAKVEKILRENTLCVLCTESSGHPYCSLMTYTIKDDLSILYMLSTQESRKYKNLLLNPNVSLLVDTRQRTTTLTDNKITAITFEGTYEPLPDDTVKQITADLNRNHAELNALLESPNCILFGIRLKSFLLLDGPIKSYKGNL